MKNTTKIPNSFFALMIYILFILFGILSLKHLPILFAPIFFSIIIVYLFNPLVNHVEKKSRLPRGVICGGLMLILVLFIVLVVIKLFPYLIDQMENAAQKFPAILKKFGNSMKVVSNYITKNFSQYIGNIDLMGKIEGLISDSLMNLSRFLLHTFSSIYNFLIIIVYLVLTPIFSYYFLKDIKRVEKSFYDLIPVRLKGRVKKKLNRIDDILSSFIRGQAIVVLILSFLYSVGLSLIGLPFAILIGIFAGLVDIVPYFGKIVGFFVSIIIGVVHYHSFDHLFLIMLVFMIVKGSENWFFYPKIVGKKVGMHFVWVILSIILFGKLFGFWGLVFAIPSMAVFKVFLKDLMDNYKKSELYKG